MSIPTALFLSYRRRIVSGIPVVLRYNIQIYIQSLLYTSRMAEAALRAASSRVRDVDMFTGVPF